MIKILLADDHAQIVEGVSGILKKAFPGMEVAAFCSPPEIVDEVAARRYDLYILDLEFRNCPDVSGFRLVSEIRRLHPGAKIIVNTMHTEYWTISRLLDMEPEGVVLKNASAETIEEAVAQVLAGERYLCPEFRQIQTEHSREIKHLQRLNVKLTEREQVVLRYIMQGFTASETARKLHVTEDTIDYHKRNLFAKFDARNNAELAAKAVAQGWIE